MAFGTRSKTKRRKAFCRDCKRDHSRAETGCMVRQEIYLHAASGASIRLKNDGTMELSGKLTVKGSLNVAGALTVNGMNVALSMN